MNATVLPRSQKSVSQSLPHAGHLAYLDGIRALAALYVLVHHALLQLNAEAAASPAALALSAVFEYGRYAVDVFIVVSGFCLVMPVIRNQYRLKEGPVVFFKRRAQRILPAYYAALALSLLLIALFIGKKTGNNWDNSLPVGQKDILTHFLLIHDFFTDTIFTINHTFWSVAVEVHIYLLFPFLVLAWRTLGATLTTVAAIAFALVLWALLSKTGLNVYGMAPHYIGLFAFGMLAAHISFGNTATVRRLPAVLFVAAAAAMVHPIIRTDLVVGVCAAAVLAYTTLYKNTRWRQLLSWPPLAFAGTFAYSIYLIHAPLLQLFSQYVIETLRLPSLPSVLLLVFVACPLITGCAYLFFLAAERPFLKKKATKKRPLPVAVSAV